MDYAGSFFPLLDLELLSCPTKVVGGDPTIPNAYLPTFDLRHVAAVDYDFVPEATHLLQLEKPAECAVILRGSLLGSLTGFHHPSASEIRSRMDNLLRDHS